VFSSSERDAAYVIDGLQHNTSIKSDIHSTDTEGYTELVFAISHLMKVSFAPRIKNLTAQSLVSFDKQVSKYKILPDRYVNTKHIKAYWDTCLRLMATILLREEKASTIMKRLASYDKQHKLYIALKEFGRIIKSCFILDFIDNVELRQQVEKQLNKGELSNRFQSAIAFANQELVQIDRDEQEKAIICQTILQNIIVLWNYVKLTKVIMTSDIKQRPYLMENITNGSVLTWRHVNMLGTYDFRNLTANDVVDVDELLSFNAA
jgi:TnpA family transposase